MIKKIFNFISIFFLTVVFWLGGFYFGSKSPQPKMPAAAPSGKTQNPQIIQVKTPAGKTTDQAQPVTAKNSAAITLAPTSTAANEQPAPATTAS